jgi:hypothetical protein
LADLIENATDDRIHLSVPITIDRGYTALRQLPIISSTRSRSL